MNPIRVLCLSLVSLCALLAQPSPTPEFPLRTATDATLLRAYDRADAKLTSPVDASTLTFNVDSGTRFGPDMVVTVENEQAKVCTVSGNIITICTGGRGFANTTPASHPSQASVKGLNGSSYHNAVREEMKAVQKYLRESTYDVRLFGAIGDGVTNDLAAIRAAISAAPAGSTVTIPRGNYWMYAGSGTELLLIDKPLNFACEGKLVIGSGVPSTVDIIRVKGPSDGGSIKGCVVQGEGGSTPGRHGVNFDATSATNGSNYIARWEVSGNRIGPFSPTGRAIQVTFPSQADGFFNSYIHHNFLGNGIGCTRCGDSNEIAHNTFTGRSPGLDVLQVYGAGALSIHHNSFVSCPPAIRVTNGSGVIISANNIEPNISAAAGCTLSDAAVEILGTATQSTTVQRCDYFLRRSAQFPIRSRTTLLSQFPLTNKYGLKLGQYARGTNVHGNRFGLGGYWDIGGTNPQKAIWIASGATNNVITGSALDYVTDWSLFLQNDSIGNGNIILTAHDGVMNWDGALTIGPNGYPSWRFNGNYLEHLSPLTFSTLPPPTGRLIQVYCADCVVGNPCTGGGTGAWAFSNGASTYKCPH